MKKIFIICPLLFIVAFLISGCAAINIGFHKKVKKDTALDIVLGKLFLERQDLTIKNETAPQDPFLLDRVSRFLASPAELISFSENIENSIQDAGNISSFTALCGNMLEVQLDETELPAEIDDLSFPINSPASSDLLKALINAMILFDNAFAKLDNEETDFLRGKLEQLLFYGSNQENHTKKENQDQIERAFIIASKIDRKKIMDAAYYISSMIDSSIPGLIEESLQFDDGQRVATPFGDVVIGSYGDDIYNGNMPILLIEPGGNDTYSFSNYSRFSIIIDLSGDDTYESSNSSFLASGIMGMGFLVDIEGDDNYQGDNFSFGCGFMGAGVLADLQGDDRYISRVFCQGAAALGMGLLYDAEGDDFYKCSLYGQGFGYVAGAGLLADIRGNDTYTAGDVFPDEREEKGAYQTYSQGYGLGCRPYASGGVGILYNGDGNDSYKGSYFCQGSSYWNALGMLIDSKGADTYIARRYSQGAGIHSSIGILSDRSGDDSYSSWGVSQGCGHDLSLGILRDYSGDDRYEAEWLSQGAGNSMGIGLLIDDNGKDLYKAGSSYNVQGIGVYDDRRDAESIGILIDRDGDDTFHGEQEGKKIWKHGDIGGGIDSGGGLSSVWHENIEKFYFKSPNTSYDDINIKENESWDKWLLAELEAPLFLEDSVERAAESLAGHGPGIIPSLLKYLEIKDVTIQRTVEEALKKMGKNYLGDIHDCLLLKEQETRKKRFLLYVLGDIGDNSSKDVYMEFLNDESDSVRAMALRGLYKIKTPPQDMSEKYIKSQNSEVRKYFCLALQESDDMKSLKLLCDFLADKDFQVRHAAYRILKKKNAKVFPFLKDLKLKQGMLPSVYRMADDIMDLKLE